MRKPRIPVLVDRDAYDVFKAYSDATGVPVSKLVREAMAAFTSELQRRLESLNPRSGQ